MKTVFEEQNISKAIVRVGLPAMLGQLTTLIYNIADTFFVSMTKEPTMIAAVTLCTPILLIIMSIASVFGMGGNSVIARLLGENDNKRVSQTLNFCIYAMALAGIVILLVGVAFMEPIARLSGADAENMAYTCDYLKYIFLGAPLGGYYFGGGNGKRISQIMRTATVYGILLGAVFLIAFWLLGTQMASLFLESLIIVVSATAKHYTVVIKLLTSA